MTNAIIALYYYLVVIKVMYVDVGPDDDKPIALPRSYAWSLGITALVVILLGTIAVTPIRLGHFGRGRFMIAVAM